MTKCTMVCNRQIRRCWVQFDINFFIAILLLFLEKKTLQYLHYKTTEHQGRNILTQTSKDMHCTYTNKPKICQKYNNFYESSIQK